MQKTLKCYECKELFPRDQLVAYASPDAKVMHNYCPKCLQEKQMREAFAAKVCQIFGIKNPGPRIWTERKRIQNTYGYTDQVLIDTLDYIYNVENKKKLADSLCLITPTTVDKMMAHKKNEENKGIGLIAAAQVKLTEHVVPIKENTSCKNHRVNIDDFLD